MFYNLNFKFECSNAHSNIYSIACFDKNSVPPDPRAECDRLKGRHFQTLIPATQNKENPQKRCIVCYKNNVRRESRYHCEQCVTNPGLCAAPCFLRYHILINYEYGLWTFIFVYSLLKEVLRKNIVTLSEKKNFFMRGTE